MNGRIIPDFHKADAAPASGLRDARVSVTPQGEPQAGVNGSSVSCQTSAAVMRWAVCGSYVGLVTWLSLAPSRVFNSVPALFAQADKLVHFLMYGFFVVVLRWAMTGSGVRWRPQGFWVAVAALVYGALMEVAQSLLVSADRSFEIWDMVANGLGALVFWSWCNLWSARHRHPTAR